MDSLGHREGSANEGRGLVSGRMWACVILAAVLATAIRVLDSDVRGFWLDEYYTLGAAQRPPAELVRERLQAGHSPLPFFWAKIPLLLGGQEEWVLRLTSSVAVGLAVIGMAGSALTLSLRRHLPALLAMCVVQPYWISIGTQYRYMMPLVALGTGAVWLAAEYARTWHWKAGLALAAITTLFFWIHGSALFLAPGLLAFGLLERRRRDGRLSWGGAALAAWPAVAAAVAILPLSLLLTGGVESGKLKFPNLDTTLRDLCEVTFANCQLLPQAVGLRAGAWWGLLAVLILAAFVLARRTLLREGRTDAWILILALSAGILPAMILGAIVNVEATGPARYLSLFSIPATLALAVSWNAHLPARSLRAWRGALATVLVIQAAVALLEPGDLHRSAVQWVLRHHKDNEPVFVCTNEMNLLAFKYLGFQKPHLLHGLPGTIKDRATAEKSLRKAFQGSEKGFVVLYHVRAPVAESLAALREEGFITDFRIFGADRTAWVGAVARTPEAAVWLRGLPAPDRLPEGNTP